MNTTPPYTRRDFLKTGGFAMAATFAAPLLSFQSGPRLSMGLQLSSLRDAMAQDPVTTLKTIAQLGFQHVEVEGYDVERDTLYGYRTTDFKRLLHDYRLTATSGHYPFSDYFWASEDALRRFVDQCIVSAKELGLRYIIWPWLAPEYRSIAHFKILAGKLNQIGEQVTQAGLGFAYHNHDFEFTDHHGEIGYDSILYDTDPELVQLQLDIYGVEQAARWSPQQLIARHPDRFVMWHIKDMDTHTRKDTALGQGSLDYKTILLESDTQALEYYYLEGGGDTARHSLRNLADSAVYFKNHLQKYL